MEGIVRSIDDRGAAIPSFEEVVALPRRCDDDRVLKLILALWLNSGTVTKGYLTQLIKPAAAM